MTLVDLFVLAFFTWYVSYAVTKTHGPFNLFEKLRARVKFGGLTTCIVCLSVWMAAFGYLLLASPYALLVWIGAAAGLAMLSHKYVGADHG